MVPSYPLIQTKIRAPRRPRALLRRDRLIDFIHEHIEYKLILLSAAAGYGKTSLLIDYVHDTDLPVCWLSLDAHDAHPPTLIEYLLASIRQRFPHFGRSIEEMLRSSTAPPEDVEPYVRLFIHEIEEHIQQYFVIVLDDYHEVIESEAVNAFVDGLLRYLPEHGHIILASRGIPRRLMLTRLAARQEVVGLGMEHLRFTGEEIYELVESLGRVHLTREQAELLAERAEGWITGILLAAQAHWTGATSDILELSGAREPVFQYLAEQVLDRQPKPIQQFLLGSAILPEMSPPLCDALLGINNSAQLLRELAEENLFTFPLDAEQTWYQYHQLFREFLVARLEQEAPVRYRQLCLRQAELMVHQGHWPEAIRGYLSARAHAQAADAIEIVAQEAFDTGNRQALLEWISALPDAILTQHPRLLLFRGRIHSDMGDLPQAIAILARAYRAFTEQGDTVGAARALVQRATVERFRGRLEEAARISRAVLEMVGDRDPLAAVQAHRNIGICHHLRGEFARGNEEMLAALEIAQADGDDVRAGYITSDLGVGELSQGNLANAQRVFHQSLLYWRRVGNLNELAIALQGLGVIHHYQGQYAEAESRLEESLAKARAAADVRVQAYTVTDQGDLYRDTGRYDQAVETYREALELASASQTTHLMLYILAALSVTHTHRGDLAQARQIAAEALDQLAGGQMIYEEGLCRLALGLAALAQAALDKAESQLHRARELLERAAVKRDLARAALYLAMAAHARGDGRQVARWLQDVAELSKELGTHQFIVAEGPMVLPLLDHIEERGIGGLDTLRLRAEIEELFPSARTIPRLEMVATTVPLEFLGLDGGQVRKNGQPITDWEAAQARNLAFLFVSHPEGLTRDRIIEMLWPDVNRAKGHSRFHSTLYRLREALFKEVVLHSNGIYRLNPECSYRYDVAEFERLAKLAHEDGDAAHIARVQAIELYHSPFLETCDQSWCDEIRGSLQTQMLQLLIDEADYCLEIHALYEAEIYYRRALTLDSFDERAHRGIMQCRALRDDRAGAIRQFNECARILAEELDVEPSPETYALYERIRSGAPVPSPQR